MCSRARVVEKFYEISTIDRRRDRKSSRGKSIGNPIINNPQGRRGKIIDQRGKSVEQRALVRYSSTAHDLQAVCMALVRTIGLLEHDLDCFRVGLVGRKDIGTE